MSALPPLAINGKFLAAAPTGVHRVAAELAHALARRAADPQSGLDIELWVPRDAADAAAAFALPAQVVRPFTHIPWEQLSLPFHRRERLLLNLCNIGPVLRGNAVTMIHDAQIYLTSQSYSLPFRLWYKALQPLLGANNRRLLTVSHYSRGEIARAGVCAAGKIDVVHNGVDHVLRSTPDPRVIARLGLTPGRYVAALASTQAHKNIALLARVFADPELAGLPLLLVGGASAQAFAAHGIALPPSAVLAGRVTDEELRALYERALCLAFPSRTEGFGLPPLEAMLLGCPAIVAPCGALPEVCGEGALYADPDDVALWARLIRRLADDGTFRASWSARGQAQARHFTWDAAADRLLDSIAGLARSAGTAIAAPAAGLVGQV